METVPGAEVEVWIAQQGGNDEYNENSCNHNWGKTKFPGYATPRKKCKKCRSKTQFRCTDGCKGGNGCHKTCIKEGDRWCQGATQCNGCGAG